MDSSVFSSIPLECNTLLRRMFFVSLVPCLFIWDAGYTGLGGRPERRELKRRARKRSLAMELVKRVGLLSQSSMSRVWRQFGMQPHRPHAFT